MLVYRLHLVLILQQRQPIVSLFQHYPIAHQVALIALHTWFEKFERFAEQKWHSYQK